MLDFYGADSMLLIGGGLLAARERLTRGDRRLCRRRRTLSVQLNGMTTPTIHRKARHDHRWEGVENRPYKEDDRALFKAVTRQVLFSDPAMAGELRYFEVAPGGFSTLERHEHMHAVLVLRGRGHCLVGREVRALESAISSPCRR